MSRFAVNRLPSLLLAAVMTVAAPCALAQQEPASGVETAAPEQTWTQEEFAKVVTEIQKKLGGLTTFSVFDWLTFGVHGKTLVLHGYASRPILKSDAENAVKKIPGIDKVENDITVLPNSMMDDRIRAQLYNRIYTQGNLRKYNANQGSIAQAMGPGGMRFAWMAGGITQNPPIGYHAIHLIVNNGHVTLYGVVLNKMDSNVAYIQANGTPGVFSVDNDLIVQGSDPGKEPE